MSRTIYGNLTGTAARQEFDELRMQRSETDIRIGGKITRVRKAMGEDFLAWYTTTPFDDEGLERALDEKIKEIDGNA